LIKDLNDNDKQLLNQFNYSKIANFHSFSINELAFELSLIFSDDMLGSLEF
jgi:hypothetical protein